jgi:hypothetical protein
MLSRNDPRIRRAIDQITQNIETANERTQENLFTFTRTYVSPCISSITECLRGCTTCCTACCTTDEERRRRHRAPGRLGGHAESNFDFYDDWEEDESDALLGFGGDERDPLLGGGAQPQRERGMSYGTRQKGSKKSLGRLDDPHENANIIRSSSYFGFLEGLPFRFGPKGLRYQPSIADLQDNPGSRRFEGSEDEATMDDIEEAGASMAKRRHRRNRSNTQGSGHTTDSLSSRGDIFPSEDEMDDAVPIDDEFALHLHLERRHTGNTTEEAGSSSRREAGNRSTSKLSLLTVSSRDSHSSKKNQRVTPTDEVVKGGLREAHHDKGQLEVKGSESPQRIDSALPSAVAPELHPSPPSSPFYPEMSSTSPPVVSLSQSPSIHDSITPNPIDVPVIQESEDQSSIEGTNPATSDSNQQSHQDMAFNAAALPKFDAT